MFAACSSFCSNLPSVYFNVLHCSDCDCSSIMFFTNFRNLPSDDQGSRPVQSSFLLSRLSLACNNFNWALILLSLLLTLMLLLGSVRTFLVSSKRGCREGKLLVRKGFFFLKLPLGILCLAENLMLSLRDSQFSSRLSEGGHSEIFFSTRFV